MAQLVECTNAVSIPLPRDALLGSFLLQQLDRFSWRCVSWLGPLDAGHCGRRALLQLPFVANLPYCLLTVPFLARYLEPGQSTICNGSHHLRI